MKTRLLVYSVVGAIVVMLGINARSKGEKLEVADGIPSATKLPLDAATSKVKFETATFGLG